MKDRGSHAQISLASARLRGAPAILFPKLRIVSEEASRYPCLSEGRLQNSRLSHFPKRGFGTCGDAKAGMWLNVLTWREPRKPAREVCLAKKRDWVLDTIRLLIGRREPAFPYEREIALFEFQTWIYLPYCDFFDERPEVEAITARVLAAAKFLKHIEKQHLKTPRANPGTSSDLISLLKINEYQSLLRRDNRAAGVVG